MTNIEAGGEVQVEGQFAGHIKGLVFTLDPAADPSQAPALRAASLGAVTTEITARAQTLAATPDTELKLSRAGEITWSGVTVGRVVAGDTLLKPRAEVVADDVLQGGLREDVRERLQKFLGRHLATVLEPLFKLEEAEGFEPQARGMAFRVVEHLGVLPREQVAEEVKALSQDDRAKLRNHGIRFGAFNLYLPALLKPAATDLRLLLWWLQKQKSDGLIGQVPTPPANGLTSAARDESKPQGFYGICGYRECGRRVVRVDMLERLADLIRDRVFWKPRIAEEARPSGSVEGGGFTVVPDMMSLVGCSGEEFDEILKSLGFKPQKRQLPKAAPVIAAPPPSAVLAPEPAAVTDGVIEEVSPADPAAEQPPAPVVEVPAEPIAQAEAANPEIIEVNVWWPKDTGPFRPKPEPRERYRPEPRKAAEGAPEQRRKPHHGKNHGDQRRDDRSKNNRRDQPAERPPKREKPMDPNSPFAVLGALKAAMTEK